MQYEFTNMIVVSGIDAEHIDMPPYVEVDSEAQETSPLETMNALGEDGWHVVGRSVVQINDQPYGFPNMAIVETTFQREIEEGP